MEKDFPSGWMWSHAFDMLARAERMHREMFRPGGSTRHPAWEPSVDILETPDEGVVLGVIPERVEAAIEGNDLVIGGTRVLPREWRTAVIHRLELPQGQFERRIRLPAGRYRDVHRSTSNGCLVITLRKAE